MQNKDGLLIFFDTILGRVLWHKFIQSETKENYAEGINFLLEKGITIQSKTIDGKRWIPHLFQQIPNSSMPMSCSKKHLKRTTRNPKSECSKRLKYIANHFILNRQNKQKFTTKIQNILQ